MASAALRSAFSSVICASHLEASHINELVEGRAAFVRIPNFMDARVCSFASEKLMSSCQVVEYENAPGVKKINDIGMAYFETTVSEQQKQKYYQIALPSIALTRSLFAPYLSPMDKLRLELDDQWPQGASLLDLGEGKMFSGLMRVLSAPVLAHEDKLERDHGAIPDHVKYVAQLAANVYLNMPNKGGELLTWNQSLNDDTYARRTKDSYGISPESLGPPSASILPIRGDLILFNPRNLHAITGSQGGERITTSTFILYQGKTLPLALWS